MNDSLVPSRRPPHRLLQRILESPDLTEQLQALPPAVLGKLIDRVGLEDAGELVALATTEQLARMFDDDLWKSDHPGEEERFDADRFLLWLGAMLEAGDAFVAKKLVELPVDLVTLAIHRQILVLDTEALRVRIETEGDDAFETEKVLADCLSEEIDAYQIISRHHEGWDDVLAALLALDVEHHDFLVKILERCCRMSSEYIEDEGGLYEVLTSAEALESDVATDREDRRAQAGHVAPADAAAFLKQARDPHGLPKGDRDPMTLAYFRGLAKAPATPNVQSERATVSDDLLRLFGGAGAVEPTPRILLPATSEGAQPLLARVMRRLADDDPRLFFERSEELAYLANVLLAGCSFRGRRMRSVEAVRAALATCSLALELSASRTAREPRSAPSRPDHVARASKVLRERHLDELFRSASCSLQNRVVEPAVETAARWLLAAARNADAEDAERLSEAALRLQAASQRGAPWKAAGELDHLFECVEPSLAHTLIALIDECPSMSGALAQERDHFVTTLSDLAAIEAFIDAHHEGRSRQNPNISRASSRSRSRRANRRAQTRAK
ncbi:MAG TPA: DUF6178 family protein [Polyangiaceae bacterium]|nr:DUF6178 family protein [Polyangiaceae bacterium]